MDENVDSKYNISGKLKATEEVWNDFLTICKDNNIEVPRYPIWTDWWDTNGENTRVTKFNKKLSDEENKEIISKKQKDFYEKYKNWIDKNRKFYEDYFDVLNPWLIKSRENPLWLGAVRKLEWQAENADLNIKQRGREDPVCV